jgi:hypothetical protein
MHDPTPNTILLEWLLPPCTSWTVLSYPLFLIFFFFFFLLITWCLVFSEKMFWWQFALVWNNKTIDFSNCLEIVEVRFLVCVSRIVWFGKLSHALDKILFLIGKCAWEYFPIAQNWNNKTIDISNCLEIVEVRFLMCFNSFLVWFENCHIF